MCGKKTEKEILAVDGFNQSIRADQTCFGTITRNAGADLKRNGQGVIEIVSRPHGSNKGGVVKSDIFPTVRKSATMDGNTGIVQPVIGAFRGRNPDNPSDRTPGMPTEQRLEINSRNLSNRLTTVQKDNVVLEPSGKQIRIRKLTPKECGRHEQNGYVRQDGTVGTLTTDGSSPKHNNRIVEFGTYYTWKDKQGNINTQSNRAANEDNCVLTIVCAGTGKVLEKQSYRIRKLTPKECGRLMGVRDDDIDTMSVNQSNSSLYHLFGDSIVVDVLMAIFKQMI